jgi:hypothetical protein
MARSTLAQDDMQGRQAGEAEPWWHLNQDDMQGRQAGEADSCWHLNQAHRGGVLRLRMNQHN